MCSLVDTIAQLMCSGLVHLNWDHETTKTGGIIKPYVHYLPSSAHVLCSSNIVQPFIATRCIFCGEKRPFTKKKYIIIFWVLEIKPHQSKLTVWNVQPLVVHSSSQGFTPGDLEHSSKVSLKENKREVSELCKSVPTKCDSGIMSVAQFDSLCLLKQVSVAVSVRRHKRRGITDMSVSPRLDKSLICHIST